MDDSGFKIHGASSTDSLVSTNTYRGYISYQLAADQTIPQDGILEIPIHQVGTVKGNWTLAVPVSGTALKNATETVFLQDASTTYDGMTLTATKVTKGLVYTDISMQLRLALEADGAPKSSLSLVELWGVPMLFNVQDINHQFIGCASINDQQFKEVGNEKVWDFTIECATPSSDVKSIIIEPTLLVMYEEGVTEGNCPKIPELAVTVPLK